ncbi:hypothetical protein GCM10025771_38800 [Niveibacterium umoris]|uniref:Uncharacterized protein n=1 Tax=Niveibacterium umoris TaxID=1193620 RepID=A0A840BGX0_9RHOO|nr:hypothetical protein [Niveibacterium umoris]MBB4010918.1 hypothetical protein [Niveibacterium umoris]
MAERPEQIDSWLAEVAGQQPGRSNRSETQALRRAILAEAAADQAGDAADEARALERLQFRLRRERLLPRNALPTWSYAVAATLAAVAIGLVVMRQAPPPAPEVVAYAEPPIWRGAFVRLDVHTPTPRAAAERLVSALRKEGVAADIYASGNVFSVDCELVAPLSPGVTQAFSALALEATPGRVRIEFKP